MLRQVFINESNIADVQADIEGPGMSPLALVPFSSAPPPACEERNHSLTDGLSPTISLAKLWLAGTPFENGKFKLKLVLGSDYPQVPPKGYFITNIFHPNVSKGGDICVNTLKQDWNPSHGIRHILMVIRCLLIEPFPESALNDEASKLLLEVSTFVLVPCSLPFPSCIIQTFAILAPPFFS